MSTRKESNSKSDDDSKIKKRKTVIPFPIQIPFEPDTLDVTNSLLPDPRPFDLEDSSYLQPTADKAVYHPPSKTFLHGDPKPLIELVRLETDDAIKKQFNKIITKFFKDFELIITLRVDPDDLPKYIVNFLKKNNDRKTEIFKLIKKNYVDIRSKYIIETHHSDLPPLDFETFYNFYVVSVLYTFCGVSHLMRFNLKPILNGVLNTLVPDAVISRPMKIKIMNYINIQVASTFSELSSISGGRRRQTNNKITKKHKNTKRNTRKQLKNRNR